MAAGGGGGTSTGAFLEMQRRGGAGGAAADSAGGLSTQDVLVDALGGNQVSNRAPGRPVGSAKSLRGGALMKGFRQAAPFASRARLTTRSTLSRFGPLGPPRFHRRTWALELLACMQSLSWIVHACRHSLVRPGRSFGLPIIQCPLPPSLWYAKHQHDCKHPTPSRAAMDPLVTRSQCCPGACTSPGNSDSQTSNSAIPFIHNLAN